ncbi:nucleotidyltransferase family protein [Pelovirga terrestris]|uniref:Nucleotidyltransferase family protein n=1 Tax=Pelovirga terrestris TaxID=2771352 RepID=A0A8J6UHD3_9BACT|nr:nucleotidyltransferase family protein [Pelovirga terrestris]MBD1401278.1 nucleotidyltransferase family protein [Pelovirga terrestris]
MKTNPEMEQQLISILRQYGATQVGIFGSYARNEATPASDLDLLVNFSERKSLMTLARIRRELTEALGLEVDLLTEAAISPYLIDSIKSQQRIIYQ